MILQFLPNAFGAPQANETDWPTFARAMSQPPQPTHLSKDQLPAWVPASLKQQTPPAGSKYKTARFARNVLEVHALVLDVDHATPEQVQAVFAKLEPFEYVAHSTYSHNPLVLPWVDPDGKLKDGASYRVIIPMTAPVPGEVWSTLYEAVNRSFGKGALDSKTKDPSRLYYLPFCPPERAHLAQAWHHPGQPFDSAKALAILEAQAPGAVAPGALPTAAAIRVTPGDLTPVIDKLEKTRGAGSDAKHDRAYALRMLQIGQPFAGPGERNSTAMSIVGALCTRFPGADPESIVDLFRPSLQQMDEPTIDEVRSMAERYVRPSSSEEMASVIQDAYRGKRSTPYTAEEWADFAARGECKPEYFVSHRLILQHSKSYHVFFDGGFLGPFTKEELPVVAAKYLSPATTAGVSTMEITGADAMGRPTWSAKSASKLVSEYGTHVSKIKYSYNADQTTYDYKEDSLIMTTAPMRDVQPEFSYEVGIWLRDMCGPAVEYVFDWLATVTDLTQAAPALYFAGPAGVGKTLLANALSMGLWGTGPLEMKRTDHQFNASLLKSPIVLADEKLRVETETLRTFIAATTREVERKYVDAIELEGATRTILAANNDNLLGALGKSDLTNEDITAIAERLIFVRIPDNCPRLGPDVAQRWLKEGTIAKHAIWLRNTRQVASTGRFACCAHGDEIANILTVDAGIRFAVLDHIIRAITDSAPNQAMHNAAVRVAEDGHAYVSESRLHQQWSVYEAFERRPQKQWIRKALDGLCDKGLGRQFGTTGARGPRYRRVNMKKLKTAVDRSDTEWDDFEEALRRKIFEAQKSANRTLN